MKAIQYFSDAYLEQCRAMKPEAVVEFLDNFRKLHATKAKSKLISLKVPEPLLAAFRARAELEGVAYQTQIKRLMERWVGRRQSK